LNIYASVTTFFRKTLIVGLAEKAKEFTATGSGIDITANFPKPKAIIINQNNRITQK
jgi:hypothetical protein